MTKEKLDSKLGDESSTTYMSLKTHPSTENKIKKFDEYKLLHNQIGILTEVSNRMTTRPQGR